MTKVFNQRVSAVMTYMAWHGTGWKDNMAPKRGV